MAPAIIRAYTEREIKAQVAEALWGGFYYCPTTTGSSKRYPA